MTLEARILELEAEQESLHSVMIARLELENTRLRVKTLEGENRRLRLVTGGLSLATVQTAPFRQAGGKNGLSERLVHRNAMSFEALKDTPRFKAFCRRKSTEPALTLAEIFKRQTKARQAEFRAYCKPKGIWSILKDGDFTTGRLIRYGRESAQNGKIDWYGETAESARFKQISGEWISEVEEMEHGLIVETMSQLHENGTQ